MVKLVIHKKPNSDWENEPPITGIPVTESYTFTDKGTEVDVTPQQVSIDTAGAYYGLNEPFTETNKTFQIWGFTGKSDSLCSCSSITQLFERGI